MKQEDTLIEFSIIPMGHSESDSISPTVAKVADRVKRSNLPSEIHSMGTVVEGSLEECLDMIKSCVREALEDVPRVTASIRLDIRPGHLGRMRESVRSVEEKMAS